MRYIKWIGGTILFFSVLYLIGPSPGTISINLNPFTIEEGLMLEQKINLQEKKVAHLKADNQARIIWADSNTKKKTPYAIVYLHGFSASQAEGYPIHRSIATRYGCNLFLTRLYAHGLQEQEPLLNLTAEKLIESAKYAIAVGKKLGDKVILMSSSTGGTLSLLLAGGDPDIAGLILYSPNIDLYDQKSFLLTQPWGLQLARLIIGDRYYRFKASDAAQHYWNTRYRIEALIQLKALLNASMNEKTFHTIQQPVFLGYYYRDEEHQDDVVSVPKMLEMYEQLGTPSTLKQKVAFPDAGVHCIASSYWSEHTQEVEKSTCDFIENSLHLFPVNH